MQQEVFIALILASLSALKKGFQSKKELFASKIVFHISFSEYQMNLNALANFSLEITVTIHTDGQRAIFSPSKVVLAPDERVKFVVKDSPPKHKHGFVLVSQDGSFRSGPFSDSFTTSFVQGVHKVNVQNLPGTFTLIADPNS